MKPRAFGHSGQVCQISVWQMFMALDQSAKMDQLTSTIIVPYYAIQVFLDALIDIDQVVMKSNEIAVNVSKN